MKTICIGDIHSLVAWKEIMRKHPTVDHVVFLGDYFDDYGNTTAEHQINNFLEICEVKKAMPHEIITLMGNHDFHYITELSHERYSGYQSGAAPAIRHAIEQNPLKKCVSIDGVLYSHAGVTKTWCNSVGVDVSVGQKSADIAAAINEVPLDKFRFTMGVTYEKYGNTVTQTPIWVRPESLLLDRVGLKQVVGHTRQKDILIVNDIAFCDALPVGKYLLVEDGEFKPMSL